MIDASGGHERVKNPGEELYQKIRAEFDRAEEPNPFTHFASDGAPTIEKNELGGRYIGGEQADDLPISIGEPRVNLEDHFDGLFRGKELIQFEVGYRVWTRGGLGGFGMKYYIVANDGMVMEILDPYNREVDDGPTNSYRPVGLGEMSDLIHSLEGAVFS